MNGLITLTLGEGGPLSHVLPHEIFRLGSISVSNHMVMATLAAGVLLALMGQTARRMAVRGNNIDDYLTQGRVSSIMEVILLYLREQMARPALGDLTDRYIGYIWSTFFFILMCSLLGLLPLAELLELTTGKAHIGGTATGNIAVTGALACVSFFMIHFVGIRQHGIKYFKHFAPVSLKGMMLPIGLLLIFLEIVGALVKPFALCMRLFANMLAGHMVLASLLGLIFLTGTIAGYFIAVPVILGSAAFMMLEIFVAFLQAFIFTFLTVLFIAQGAVHHDDPHDHDPHTEHEHLPMGELIDARVEIDEEHPSVL